MPASLVVRERGTRTRMLSPPLSSHSDCSPSAKTKTRQRNRSKRACRTCAPMPAALMPGPAWPAAFSGWAQYGYCASHSRWFWGLRLHLVCTLHGLPVAFALTGAKADERETLPGMLTADPALAAARPGQVIIGDKNYYGRDFETALAAAELTLLRPARKGEPQRAGSQFFKPLRQVIESVNDTFKGQLDLERHGGRTPQGVTARVLQRILALTAAIWHNDATGQPVMRSLLAYDH
jgi:hypothetical protein